jgi:hypothetical protein
MLPKRPGYPIGNPADPVQGQSLANDSGQTNAFGSEAVTDAAGYHDKDSAQNLPSNLNDERLWEKRAGLLPKVLGPNILIQPPEKEATRIP